MSKLPTIPEHLVDSEYHIMLYRIIEELGEPDYECIPWTGATPMYYWWEAKRVFIDHYYGIIKVKKSILGDEKVYIKVSKYKDDDRNTWQLDYTEVQDAYKSYLVEKILLEEE